MSKHLLLLHRRHAKGEHHINVNELHEESMGIGEHVADAVASGMGSWKYIIFQSVIVVFWIVLNSAGWFIWHWDLPPFILLNLIFSTQASYAAPIIMMSQNRQATKDRLAAENDYHVNQQAEQHIETILNRLDAQDKLILKTVENTQQIVEQIATRKMQKKSLVG